MIYTENNWILRFTVTMKVFILFDIHRQFTRLVDVMRLESSDVFVGIWNLYDSFYGNEMIFF